MRAGIRRL